MAINLNDQTKEMGDAFVQSLGSGDADTIKGAFEQYNNAIMEDVAEQFEQARSEHDNEALVSRGFHVLTSQERAYYDRVIEAFKAPNVQQAFAAIPDNALPTTVVEDVMRNIAETHPLLGAINMVSTGAVTRYIRNAHTRQLAKWGALTTAVSQEITSAFKAVDLKQAKLSCFAAVSRDMLELGPTWLDGYVRTVLTEAMAAGLEDGVVNGTGVDMPIGLTRDPNSDFSSSTGYKVKTAVSVTDFEPASYGKLVANLAKNEGGMSKQSVASLSIVCNPTDYLTKIMPATTVLNNAGVYVNGLFPVPTAIYQSAAVADGTAVMFLADEYDLFVGGNRGIESSDDYQFLDDNRVFKTVTYANGSAYDNTSAQVLDISGLEPAYLNVKVKGTVTTKASE